MKLQRVYAADCLGPDGMPSMVDREVDIVITDPPYSRKVHECGRRGMSSDYVERDKKGRSISQRAQFSRTRDLGFDHLTPYVRDAAAAEFARVARRWVLVFCDVEQIHDWRTDLERHGLEYVRTCFWVKLRATPQFTGDRPGSHVEAIVCAHVQRDGRPVKKAWRGGGRGNVFTHPVVMNPGPGTKVRVHSTQKPLALLRELVGLFSDPGELVLDAFAGSGTTGVACRQLHRKFIGFEFDREVAQVAADRIVQTRPRALAGWKKNATRKAGPSGAEQDRGKSPR